MQIGTDEARNIEVPVTLNLTRGNKIRGNGGCNSYGGSYFLRKNNTILFKNIISTKMFCGATSNLEGSFFQGLQAAKTAKVKNGQLYLENREKGIILVFVKNK